MYLRVIGLCEYGISLTSNVRSAEKNTCTELTEAVALSTSDPLLTVISQLYCRGHAVSTVSLPGRVCSALKIRSFLEVETPRNYADFNKIEQICHWLPQH